MGILPLFQHFRRKAQPCMALTELRKRVLSSLVLLPFGVALPHFGEPWFSVAIGAIVVLGLREWLRMTARHPVLLLAGTLLLSMTAISLHFIYHGQGAYGVLLLFILVWLTDIAAFACGRRWGRHKLAPRISPNKTWEGLFGAIIVAAPFGALGYGLLLRDRDPAAMLLFLPIAVMAVLLAQAGDLLESRMKRQCAIKDSGRLIPGHGGVLDRIDGLLLTAPFMAVMFPLLKDWI